MKTGRIIKQPKLFMKLEESQQKCSAESLNSFHEEAARSQALSCCLVIAVCEKPAPPRFHPHSSWAAFATRCTLGSDRQGAAIYAASSKAPGVNRSHPDGAVRGFSFWRWLDQHLGFCLSFRYLPLLAH